MNELIRFTQFAPSKARFRFYGGARNYASVARDVLSRSMTSGDDCERLEENVAAFVGRRHGVCMPQARVGIYLTLSALLRDGKRKVVLSPYTIHDVINMVICAGGEPVFADIVRETCNIDPKQIEQLVDDQTGAVLVTHLHGMACDIEPITRFCQERGVPLIEDTAQAFGGRVGGRALGSFGTAGVFSFGQAKNVNCYYGAMVVTDDDALAATLRRRIESFPYQAPKLLLSRVANCLVGDVLTSPLLFRSLTNHVFRYGYLHDVDFITSRVRGEDDPQLKRSIPESYLRRMTPMQARLVNQALATVDENSRARIRLADLYWSGLQGLPDVILPPHRTDGSHIYLSYPIQVPDRHDLLRFLTRCGRDLTVQHIGNNAAYPCFSEWARDCPNAALTGDQVLLLPTYPTYGEREVERNVEFIRAYFAQR